MVVSWNEERESAGWWWGGGWQQVVNGWRCGMCVGAGGGVVEWGGGRENAGVGVGWW